MIMTYLHMEYNVKFVKKEIYRMSYCSPVLLHITLNCYLNIWHVELAFERKHRVVWEFESEIMSADQEHLGHFPSTQRTMQEKIPQQKQSINICTCMFCNMHERGVWWKHSKKWDIGNWCLHYDNDPAHSAFLVHKFMAISYLPLGSIHLWWLLFPILKIILK
jgi:hypothetical protein